MIETETIIEHGIPFQTDLESSGSVIFPDLSIRIDDLSKSFSKYVDAKRNKSENEEKKVSEYTKMINGIKNPKIKALFKSYRNAIYINSYYERSINQSFNLFMKENLSFVKEDVIWHESMNKSRSSRGSRAATQVIINNRLIGIIAYSNGRGRFSTRSNFGEDNMDILGLVYDRTKADEKTYKKSAKKIYKIMSNVSATTETLNSMYRLVNCRHPRDGSNQGSMYKPVIFDELKEKLRDIRTREELEKSTVGFCEAGFTVSSAENNKIVFKKKYNSFRFMSRYLVPLSVTIDVVYNTVTKTVHMSGKQFGSQRGKWHPHCNHGEFCTGNFSKEIKQAIEFRDGESLNDIILLILNCFNPGSPYHTLSQLEWGSVMDEKTKEWILPAQMQRG